MKARPGLAPLPALPDDPDIPALARAAEQGLASVLAGVGIHAPVTSVRVAKYHPGQRCTLVVDAGREPLVVKCYSHDPTREAELLEALRSKGLASGRPPTVAPLVACEPGLSVLVTRFLAGPSSRELVRNGSGERAGKLAAAWLRCASELPGVGEHTGVDDVLRRARSRARMIGRVDSGLGAAAVELADALAATAPPAKGSVLVHGSFYADHVLDVGGGPGIIDWDRFRGGPIECDAAMFLATLSLLTTKRSELSPQARAAEEELMAGMREVIDVRSLRWQQAAALVTLAKRLVADRRRRLLGIRPDFRRAAALLVEAGQLAEAAADGRSLDR
jgi:aminoglycoside phosphotransferase (APT) family kinase protein